MPDPVVLRSEFLDALRAEFARQVETIQFKGDRIEIRDIELMFDAAILLALAKFLPKEVDAAIQEEEVTK